MGKMFYVYIITSVFLNLASKQAVTVDCERTIQVTDHGSAV
jgi:hypothetical protein